LYFSDVYTIFYELLKFNEFLKIENKKQNWKNGLKWRRFWPRASWHRPGPAAKGSRLAHIRPTRWARVTA
jgi:hypothetical protein